MDRAEQLKSVADFFALVMGPQTEVVVHDLKAGRILHIVNGFITGRQAGALDGLSGMKLLAQRADRSTTPGMTVGYSSTSKGARKLRCSNLFLRDEQGGLSYAICVNQDVSDLEALQRLVNSMACAAPEASPRREAQTIEDLTFSVIVSEIEQAKPFSLDSREAKMSILRRLDEKGVFEVRRAVPKVCELLGISQATLYKYLKEIKNALALSQESHSGRKNS